MDMSFFEVGDLCDVEENEDTSFFVSDEDIDKIAVQVCKELMLKWTHSFEHTKEDFIWIRSVISFWFDIETKNWSDQQVTHFTCQTFLNINFAKCEPVPRDE